MKNNMQTSSGINTTESSSNSNKTQMAFQKNPFQLPVPVEITSDMRYRMINPLDPNRTVSDVRNIQSYDFSNSTSNMPEAKLKQYQSETSRLATYTCWPDSAPIKPGVLARAGLFYTGIRDKVKCPFCLGSMYNWEEEDNPLTEHAKHYRDCPFVKYKINEHLSNNVVYAPGSRSYVPSRAIGFIESDAADICIAAGPGSNSAAILKTKQQNSSLTQIVGDKPIEPQTTEKTKFAEVKAVKIVHQMGYSLSMISAAVKSIPNCDPTTLKSSILLDAIYELEAEEFDTEDETGEENDIEEDGDDPLIRNEPQGAMNTQLFEDLVPENKPPISTQNLPDNTLTYQFEPLFTQPETSSSPEFQFSESNSEFFSSNAPSDTHTDPVARDKAIEASDSEYDANTCSKTEVASPEVDSSQSTPTSDKEDMDPVTQKLAEEHHKLIQNKICNVCKKDNVSVLFLPCRHLICCESCANKSKVCAHCKSVIVGTVKIYLS